MRNVSRKASILTAILLFGAFLLFRGLRWGDGYYLHPDETRILIALGEVRTDKGLEGLDPKFYAYGHLPLYLIKILNELLTRLPAGLVPVEWLDLVFAGRFLSALFSLLTLLAVFFLGRRLYGETAGLLASGMLAVTALAIQAAHFLTVDSFLTFIVVLGILQALKIRERPGFTAYTVFGLLLGAGLSTKFTALYLVFPLAAAHFTAPPGEKKFHEIRRGTLLLWALLAAVLVIFITQPYLYPLAGRTLFPWGEAKIEAPLQVLSERLFHVGDISNQLEIVQGKIPCPFTLQYNGTTPFLYPCRQLLLFGAGIPLGLLYFFGLIASTVRWVKSRSGSLLVVLSFLLPFFFLTSSLQVKFPRYLLPAIPLFAVLAAGEGASPGLLQARKRLGFIILSSVLLTTAAYAIGFSSIYVREHSAVRATRWMAAHIPSGAAIMNEGPWEAIRIPLPLRDQELPAWQETEWSPYDPDTPQKLDRLAKQLARADVFVISTNRQYASLTRVPFQYPLTSRFYRALFERALGFELQKTFTTFPGFLGFHRSDLEADESLTVYDHPVPLIFRNVMRLDPQEIRNRILETTPPTGPGTIYALIKTPASDGYESLRLFLLWFFASAALGFVFLPIGMTLMPGEFELAYGVSRVFGLLLPAYICWALVSFGFLTYGRGAVLAGLLASALLSVTVGSRAAPRWCEIFRSRRKFLIAAEVTFFAVGALFFAFRVTFPNIYWSESPMDYSILKRLDRGGPLPPADPWLSGYPLNYYYYGQYLISFLTKLLGTAPSWGYNLGLVLVPALLGLVIFVLLYRLTGRIAGGLLGVALGVFAGNLDPLVQAVEYARGIHSKGFFDFFRTAHEVIPFTVHEYPLFSFLFQDLHAHLLDTPLAAAAICIALATALEIRRDTEPHSVSIWMRGLFLGLLLGSSLLTNAWDFPLLLGFLLLSSLLAALFPGPERIDWRQKKRRLFKAAGPLLIAVLCSALLFAPYHARHSAPVTGVGFLSADDLEESSRGSFIMLGLFILISFAYCLRELEALRQNRSIGPFALAFLSVSMLAAVTLTLAGRTVFSSLAVLLLAGALLLYLLRSAEPENGTSLFPLVSLMMALLIVISCDYFYIREFLAGGPYRRMNTLFKFYYQTWLYFSVASAFFLLRMLKRRSEPPRRIPGRLLRWAFLGVLVLLACFSFATFPLVWKSRVKRQNSWDLPVATPLTLDGFVYLDKTEPYEYEAIRWLDTNAAEADVILEASDRDYLYQYSRVSAITGLPTVLGWWSHVEQREHWKDTEERKRDLERIYNSAKLSDVPRLLSRYGVRYIHVGKPEIELYGEQVRHRFDAKPFAIAYRNTGVTVYRFCPP